MKKTINEHFSNDDRINALFISHFDTDHINGLPILLNEYSVDKIYLPVLSKAQKIFLNIVKRDKDTMNFINGPIQYISRIIGRKFNNKITIVFVKYTNEDDSDFDEEDFIIENENDNDNVKVKYINSGETIDFKELDKYKKFGDDNFWEYIPYNISFSAYGDLNKKISKICGKSNIKKILKSNDKVRIIRKNIVMF